MADLTGHHLVDHLERDGFVILKRPPISGHAGDWDWMATK
jgi:hypothetical protein